MRYIDFSMVLTRAAFKLIPTILIIAYLWTFTATSITEFHVDVGLALTALSVGMIVSFFLYSYRVRFSVTFLLLLTLLFVLYKVIGSSTFGEFDAFYLSVSFLFYGTVFLIAWAIGYGFVRFSYFPWIAAIATFLYSVLFVFVDDYQLLQKIIADQSVQQLTVKLLEQDSQLHRLFMVLLGLFAPVLFYGVYIIYINELLRKIDAFSFQNIGHLVKRTIAASVILLLILLSPLLIVRMVGFNDLLYERLNDAQVNSADFLKKTYNPATNQPQFDLQEYAQLQPEVKLSDETVFCTYIDNFFPTEDGRQIPLPVHFRRYVLNRYEPGSEKFVLDAYPPSAIPNDLFSPSTKDIPIGFPVEDSVIETSTAHYAQRKDISSTVYIQSLDPNAYIAPNTGYYYEKLPVPPEDQETFHTVYQCSSLISIWNLPPFVYSTNQPELVQFREARAQALRADNNHGALDSTFLEYYTRVDTTDSVIMNLSRELTEGQPTGYDKVESIVNYFLGTDEQGNPRFTYSLKPGAPDNPNQSLMHYFLQENKKGYCTYFAGATTLLLRAAGIPCRMAVGYAIFDRSNKNSGWYWVYADQGHAWVEVYFPRYGWIDFDTTPSEDSEPSRPPKPDATPPQHASEPMFAVLGKLTGITADSTSLFVRPYSIRYRGKSHEIADDVAQVISIKPPKAMVTIDEEAHKIGEFPIKSTMVLSSYSSSFELQQIGPYRSRKPFMSWFVQNFPETIPVDEARIVYKEEETTDQPIFAVDGQIHSILPDTSGLTVIPNNIFYRGKNYQIGKDKAPKIHIRPDEAVIYSKNNPKPIRDLTVGDSMLVKAESSKDRLRQLQPFLATEPFLTWFTNTFPPIIPVDRVTLETEETPFFTKFAWALLILLGVGIIVLLFLGLFIYSYTAWRIDLSQDKKKLYWVYRMSLMVLNQMGFYRALKTPLEYARQSIDPKFGTQLGEFMDIYLKAKYSPYELAFDELQFVERFRSQFRQKVFSAYSKQQVIRSFANFIRTLRFIFAK